VLGPSAGLDCDANASDATFPEGDGGHYSYDCFPSPGKNTSGSGLRITPVLTTGSVSLASNVPCGFPPYGDRCPCGVCDRDRGRACTSNADCGESGGTCGPRAVFSPAPHQCEGECVDTGGGEGECDPGQDDHFCDGVVRANGEGFIMCQSNGDCAGGIIDNPSQCTMTHRRRCFLPTIEATGTASAGDPLLVAAYCSPFLSNAADNIVVGLPGPARERIQVSSVLSCAGSSADFYPACPAQP
jgi:hypothetical protein